MKQKFRTKFPAARIKKLMQKDEEVGKLAAAVPIAVSKAIELFLQSLLDACCHQLTNPISMLAASSSTHQVEVVPVSTVQLDSEQTPRSPMLHTERALSPLQPKPDIEVPAMVITSAPCIEARRRSASGSRRKVLTKTYVKRAIEQEDKFDFLRDLVAQITDQEPPKSSEVVSKKRRKESHSDSEKKKSKGDHEPLLVPSKSISPFQEKFQVVGTSDSTVMTTVSSTESILEMKASFSAPVIKTKVEEDDEYDD